MTTVNTREVFVKRIGEQPLPGEGNCIEKNTQRLCDFWFKLFTDKREMFNLMVLKIRRKDDDVIIHHLLIHNLQTNQLIDVSNGSIKIVDKDTYYGVNKPLCDYTFTFGDFREVLLKMGIQYVCRGTSAPILRQVGVCMFEDMIHHNLTRPRKNSYAKRILKGVTITYI